MTISSEYMEKMAEAIGMKMAEDIEGEFGFVFITVSPDENGNTDFNYISNISDKDTIKELMTEVVTCDETLN